MRVREVVTGHDAKGRAVVARDEQIDGMPIPGLGELAVLWSADEPATYPNAGNNPGGTALFPPVGGVRFVMATYSPGEFVASGDVPEMHIEEGDKPGMHRTDSTDFGVLISGKLALDLGDGAEVLLSPGDVVVQNGTRHRWRVVGDVPATMAAFIIGAHRV
jgi:quercetin dioxygenase-like cupin family protein